MKTKKYLFATLFLGVGFVSLLFAGVYHNKVNPVKVNATEERAKAEPVASYQFQNADNPGYDSATKDGTNAHEMQKYGTGEIAVNDGVATLDGNSALVFNDPTKDPTFAYATGDMTLAFTFSAPAVKDWGNTSKWGAPVSFRFSSWSTACQFLIQPLNAEWPDVMRLRYWNTDSEAGADMWNSEPIVDMQPGVKYSILWSMDADGVTKIFVNGSEHDFGANRSSFQSAWLSDWSGLNIGGFVYKSEVAGGGHDYVGFHPNYTTIPGMTIENVQFFNCAFTTEQAVLFQNRGFLYADELRGLEEDQPYAKYAFNDATNPGKDTGTGNHDLEMVNSSGVVQTSGITLNEGVATFDTSTALVSPKDNDLLEALNNKSFTVKVRVAEAATQNIILSMKNRDWAQGDGLLITTWGNRITITVDDGSSTTEYAKIGMTGGNAVWGYQLTENCTNHIIIASVELGGKANVYVDGALAVSADLDNDMAMGGGIADFGIGGQMWRSGNDVGSQAFLNGQLGEVRVYDRALDAGEIATLYRLGEVYKALPLPTQYTISFGANGGTGTMAEVTKEENSTYTLPANGFTAPAGKEFEGWKVNGQGGLLQPGATITITADVELVAQWKDAEAQPEQQPDQGGEQGGEQTPAEPAKKKGCGSSVVATSAIISLTSIIGSVLLFGKRKER